MDSKSPIQENVNGVTVTAMQDGRIVILVDWKEPFSRWRRGASMPHRAVAAEIEEMIEEKL